MPNSFLTDERFADVVYSNSEQWGKGKLQKTFVRWYIWYDIPDHGRADTRSVCCANAKILCIKTAAETLLGYRGYKLLSNNC